MYFTYKEFMLSISMPLDDGRMAETCCDINIRGGGEELLR
jgi:hypothetical protein